MPEECKPMKEITKITWICPNSKKLLTDICTDFFEPTRIKNEDELIAPIQHIIVNFDLILFEEKIISI